MCGLLIYCRHQQHFSMSSFDIITVFLHMQLKVPSQIVWSWQAPVSVASVGSPCIIKDKVASCFDWVSPLQAIPACCMHTKLSSKRIVWYCLRLTPFVSTPASVCMRESRKFCQRGSNLIAFLYPPQTFFGVGILFSRCPCVRPSVTFFFFLISWRVIAGFSSNLANMFIYAKQIL